MKELNKKQIMIVSGGNNKLNIFRFSEEKCVCCGAFGEIENDFVINTKADPTKKCKSMCCKTLGRVGWSVTHFYTKGYKLKNAPNGESTGKSEFEVAYSAAISYKLCD